MANFAHTNQRLLQAIFQITRPQVRPGLNVYSGRQQRSPFSGARPQGLPANGFSISFPIEFDEVAEELVSQTKRATQKNTKKPKPRGLEVSKYPQKHTSKNPGGTVATGKTQTAGRPMEYTAAEKGKQTPRTAEETDSAHTVVELDDDVLDSYDPLDASADLPFEPEDMPPSPATAVTSRQIPKFKQAASPAPATSRSPPRPKENWQIQKAALLSKFPPTTGGWNPRKKLSPDTIEGIRALHEQYPEKYTTPVLASEFKVSAEAVRRILRSKWRPETAEKIEERRERWARRHDRIWDTQAELGLRPKRTKVMKTERDDAFEEGVRARQILVNR